MNVALQALPTLLPVLYLSLAFVLGLEFAVERPPRRAVRRILTGALILAETTWFGCLWASAGYFPVTDTWISISLLALSLVLCSQVVEVFARTAATSGFVVACGFVLQLLASSFAPRAPRPAPEGTTDFFVLLHVPLVIFATAAMILSGAYGALYLLQLRQLRRGTFGSLFRGLPDLDALSRMNRGAAVAGFAMLGIGLNVGIWWAHRSGIAGFSYWDPKVSSVLLLWLLFGFIGTSRWTGALSGRQAAVVAVAGLSLCLLSLVISFVPRVSFHDFAG